MKNNTRRVNKLEPLLALRAFACLLVLAMHCYGTLPQSNWEKVWLINGYNLSWLLYTPGQVGVWIFFCLSGYLMGKAFYTARYPISRIGVLNFWRNRILRVLPLYYFNLLLLFIFVTPTILKPENWESIYRMFVLDYQEDLPYNPNGALWSVSTEFQYYMIAPFVFVTLNQFLKTNKRILLTLVLCILFMLLTRTIFWLELRPSILLWTENIYHPLYFNIDLFITGFLINAALLNQVQTNSIPHFYKFLNRYKVILLTIILGVFYLVSAYISYNTFVETRQEYQDLFVLGLPILTGLTTFFVIYNCEYDQVVNRACLKNEKLSVSACLRNPLRIFEVFGILTYGIYVWHSPLLESIEKVFYLPIPINDLLLRFTVVFVLSTLLASITYFVIEVPAERLKTFSSPVAGKRSSLLILPDHQHHAADDQPQPRQTREGN